MNSNIFETPRILIVEDEVGAVAALESELRNAILGVEITSVGAVAQGKKALREAHDCQRPFDVALLDFRLPEEATSGDVVPDFELGVLLGSLLPQTFVIHMSAHADDPEFQKLKVPESPVASERLYVDKLRLEDWTLEVAKACARHIYTSRVRAACDELFGEGPRPADRHAVARSSSGRSDQARSLALAALCDFAGRHWVNLEPELQKRLDATLGHIQDSQGLHYVGTIQKSPGERNGLEGPSR